MNLKVCSLIQPLESNFTTYAANQSFHFSKSGDWVLRKILDDADLAVSGQYQPNGCQITIQKVKMREKTTRMSKRKRKRRK